MTHVAAAQRSVSTSWVHSADGTRIRAWRSQGVQGALPVVVSNGLGTPPEAWPAVLADPGRFDAVGWYYRGTAGSDRPADPSHVAVEHHVEDLIAVMDDAGLDRAVLASWSVGVNVAFEAARRHPDRVAGLLAVAGVPGGTFRAMGHPIGLPRRLREPIGTGAAKAVRLGAPAVALLLKALPMHPATAWLIAHSGIMLPAATPDRVLPALREFRSHDWRWYMTLALAMAEHEPMDLRFVTVPTTFVAGRWDVLTSYRDLLAVASTVEHCTVGAARLPLPAAGVSRGLRGPPRGRGSPRRPARRRPARRRPRGRQRQLISPRRCRPAGGDARRRRPRRPRATGPAGSPPPRRPAGP